VNLGTTIGLGVRLALGGGRRGLTRLLLTAVGVGVGVALLIGGLGLAPALQARHGRELAREPVPNEATAGTNYALWQRVYDQIGRRDVTRTLVAGVGHAPVPPGLARLPGPGELAVSPALAQVLTTPLGRIARERMPGRIIELIGPEGLAAPDELVAYMGVPASRFRHVDASRVTGFGGVASPADRPIRVVVKLLILLGVAGLLVPTLVFVATSTRLSASSRERRLAAIRLVGGTPKQVRVLAAVEGGVGAALGSLLGVALFFVLRPIVAGISMAGYRWYPSDIAPPLNEAVLVVLVAPLLAVLASLASLRRLLITPLGVARRARVRRRVFLRPVPLVAGLAGLGWCFANRPLVNSGGFASLVIVFASFALLLIGVTLVAPWLGAAAASWVARAARRMGSVLGARRLQLDPTGAGRVASVVALVVFAAGVVLAIAPAADSQYGDIGLTMRPTTVMVVSGPHSSGDLRRRFGSVQGVRSVIPLSTVSAGPQAPEAFTAWIVDCRDLQAALTQPFPRCSAAPAYRGRFAPRWLKPGITEAVTIDGWDGSKSITMNLPNDFVSADIRQTATVFGSDLILPPSVLPRSARSYLHAYTTLVRTDGTDATVERIRNATAGLDFGAHVSTLEQTIAEHRHTSIQIASLVDLGVLVALGIALANLLVVTIDHVQERRRAVGVLAACGVPLRTLSGSVAVEAGLAVIPGVAGAAVFAVAVARIFGAIIGRPVAFPSGRVAVLSLLTLAAVGLVTLLTLPALRGAARPETLQVE
jgi:FtsX-like permease family protein